MKVLLALMFVSLAGCASPWKDTKTDLDMSVSGNVSAQLKQHTMSGPKSSLRSIALRETYDSAGNFGLVHFEYATNYSNASDGLLVEQASATWRSPANPVTGTFKSTATSACAFLDVTREAQSILYQSMTSAVVVGRALLTMDNGISTNSVQATRLDNLATTAPNLCSPVPGTAFTYQVQKAMNRKLRGNVGNSHGERTSLATASCIVDSKRYSAQELHASIRGDYLKVTCDSVEDNDKKLVSYAYLIDSEIYLKLAVAMRFNKQTNRYSDAVYVDSP